MLEKRVIEYLQSQQMSLCRKTILVGVSGGPDSVALLHFLVTYQKEWDTKIVAVIVNHQLRAEAEEEITYVKELCRKLNVPLDIVTINVKAYREGEQKSTQVAARELRYEAYAKKMQKHKAHYLALGHHGDDQVETTVFHLMRAADVISLQGIPFSRSFASGHIVRPLLCLTKEEIRIYCQVHSLHPRVDASNEDESYTRNYVRKQIVPKLKQYNANLHETIRQLQDTLQADEHFLQSEAKKAYDQCVTRIDGKYDVDYLIYQTYNEAIKRRIYRKLMSDMYQNIQVDLSYIHYNDWQTLINSEHANKQLHFPANVIVERSYERIIVYFAGKAMEVEEEVTTVPRTVELVTGERIRFTTEVVEDHDDPFVCYIPEKYVAMPYTVRTRRPGDRMTYRGLNGSKKIKDILIDEKIPRMKRDEIVIIEDGNGTIIWLVGMKKHYPTVGKNEKAICIRYDSGSMREDS